MKKTKRGKILKQKSLSEWKGKNLLLQSIKGTANGNYIDKTLVSASFLSSLKTIKKGDTKTFNTKCYPFARPDALAIDSESKKLGLCNHARARQHVFNPIARAINRPDLVVDYTKAKKIEKARVKMAKARKQKVAA